MMTVPAAVAFLGVAGAAGQGTFALGFMVLPQAFAKMGSSVVFGSLFFLLLTVAAVTSSISMMQVGLSFIEEFMGLKRKMAVVVQGFFTATGTFIVAWYSGNLLAMDTYDFFLGTLCFFVSAMVMMILFPGTGGGPGVEGSGGRFRHPHSQNLPFHHEVCDAYAAAGDFPGLAGAEYLGEAGRAH